MTATDSARRFRVRAPELRGRGWLNTGGRELSLADLRGRIVLLDFWTFCCINCLHVLEELRPVEEEFGDQLVVVGVHSPKFEHERDPEALAAAVERYDVPHPVLDDPELITWQQYAARAWPTLAVVDPEGYLVASMSGEGHAEGLRRLIRELIDQHTAKGTLRTDGVLPEKTAREDTELRFPGKIALLPGGSFLVSDSAHHSIVELAADGETVLRRIGTGVRGSVDGTVETAQFAEPQGVCVLPAAIAEKIGYDVLVADTVNHQLRAVSLADGTVRTVAGTGETWRGAPGDPVDVPADPLAARLSSPWDVAWYEPINAVVVAMAGTHQLWSYDPVAEKLAVYAGTTVESLRDGTLEQAWFAQPSGLASDGTKLWIADSESSALRWIEDGEVHTAVGKGLFDFGAMDGPAADALFQHPLGVAVLPDGSVAVCDTYNNAVRRYDPVTNEVSTLATGVAEPSGAVVADGTLVVVESAAHRVVRPIPPGTMSSVAQVDGTRHRTKRPPVELSPGPIRVEVVFEPPAGQKLDDRYGPSTRLEISANPPALLADGLGVTTDLERQIVLAAARDEAEPTADGDGVLQVIAHAASCDVEGPNPACHLSRQDWGIPIRLVPGAPTELVLMLRGVTP
ncbi:NHL domain-containing thioredoxin family protein [Cryptosporangium aurantiacum]|uniref:Thiol-disulfide isomerase or thioredoxin n=1 Tax=Cryptosporangium aurantiacum TaxID=134849 RepID=A0A1M7RKM3_9ACTN|nr:NHL domain-containing thioredoxin family protein [Cryptosporangium aurantiacum]SHN46895.1 Thiol-disulfide isomerase or thioredoxin [Cryptosporangium aurantiacum]